jgi:hypothetical protein
MILEDIVSHCRKKLNISDDVLISVEPMDLSGDNVKGWAYDQAGDGEYDIEIEETMTANETIRTICHEMVHIKQMENGEEIDEDEANEREVKLAKSFKRKK